MGPVIFLLVGLLAGSSTLVQAKADPEEGVRWALGLDLPRMDGFSLWRVGPDRAWGLALTRADYTHNNVTEPYTYRDKDGKLKRNDEGDFRLASLVGSFTVQWVGPSSGDVAAFTFGTLLGGYNYVHWPNWDQEERTRVFYSAGLKGGIGVAWKPFERVGLFVSQGVEVQFQKNDFPSYKTVASLPQGLTYYRSDTWSAGLSAPWVVAFWMF